MPTTVNFFSAGGTVNLTYTITAQTTTPTGQYSAIITAMYAPGGAPPASTSAVGCSGKNTATPPADPGTTPGAYTVTVTGSSGAITATTAVTVTVN